MKSKEEILEIVQGVREANSWSNPPRKLIELRKDVLSFEINYPDGVQVWKGGSQAEPLIKEAEAIAASNEISIEDALLFMYSQGQFK